MCYTKITVKNCFTLADMEANVHREIPTVTAITEERVDLE